jgi:hypothetical protein
VVNGAGSGNSFKAGGLLGPTLPAGTATARIHEPSAWLRGVAATRVRQIKALHLDASAFGAIVAPLGRTGALGSREDRSCDRCRIYVPEGDLLYLFVHRPTPRIFLSCGLCSVCAQKEAIR